MSNINTRFVDRIVKLHRAARVVCVSPGETPVCGSHEAPSEWDKLRFRDPDEKERKNLQSIQEAQVEKGYRAPLYFCLNEMGNLVAALPSDTGSLTPSEQDEGGAKDRLIASFLSNEEFGTPVLISLDATATQY